MTGESSKDDGDEATSKDQGSLQSQLDRTKAKLAARDASARKYKVHSTPTGGSPLSIKIRKPFLQLL